jgi:type IV pilus assembly protein PilC
MVTYKYKALSKGGIEIEGVIKAHDKNDAVIKLKEEYGLIVDIKEVASLDLFKKDIGKGKVTDKDIALMCQQFSILLTAGLPIARTVELVGVRSENKALKHILTSVAEDVTAGYSLAGSFQARAQNLPISFIETIRAGEESGSLEMAFGRLAGFFDAESDGHFHIFRIENYLSFYGCDIRQIPWIACVGYRDGQRWLRNRWICFFCPFLKNLI